MLLLLQLLRSARIHESAVCTRLLKLLHDLFVRPVRLRLNRRRLALPCICTCVYSYSVLRLEQHGRRIRSRP